jgi:tripartite-type tricarboxylate transporter receptor subunit TctC
MAAEVFKAQTGTDLLHVPYKGSGPAVIDLAEGRVQMMFDGIPAFLSHIQAGKLLPLAACAPTRNPLLPDVPTFAELGFKGMEVSLWYGLVAPAGTPGPIIYRLNTELQKALQTAAVKTGFAEQSIEPGGGSPADFGAFMTQEMTRWGGVVKAAGIEPE